MSIEAAVQETAAPKSTYLKLSLVAVIWGGTFVAGRNISPDTPPLLSASLRFILASFVLSGFLLVSGRLFLRLNAVQFMKIVGLGFCGIFSYNLFFFYGLHFVTASRASLIVALNPAAMAIASFLIYRESLSPVKIAGIALCLAGAMIVILSKNPQALSSSSGNWAGDTLIFGCVLSWVSYSVFGRDIIRQIGPLHTVAYSIWAGAVMLTLTAILGGQLTVHTLAALPFGDLACLLYLGAVGSAVAYVWYYEAIGKIGATRSGVFIALNPLTAVLLGAALLKETLTFSMLIGGALVIVGIVLCNRSSTNLGMKSRVTPDLGARSEIA
ncbi:DMT family transporter [Allorhizobium sp. BGMRC 0089]|uniref:DMT family transporter n=1 Tax=Allorhizobium sonneratiae TaxID=2934936 RepID=UPI00203331AA|nr:EamA family transporter [Allorhizobium sonneratiae]MCM2294355.1 DMT family transporter [Allorhizobium sonneratiae]